MHTKMLWIRDEYLQKIPIGVAECGGGGNCARRDEPESHHVLTARETFALQNGAYPVFNGENHARIH